jgi:hypothetical protein
MTDDGIRNTEYGIRKTEYGIRNRQNIMNNDNSYSNQLLIEGIAAARAGDTQEAQRLLRRVTELEPDNAQAWLWRASVVENRADKKTYLQEVLTLEPDNVEAKLAFQRIQELEGEVTARVEEDEMLYCTVHPERETMLRCNRCGRPMCPECAVRHPVGLRCRECVNQTRSPIYQVDLGTTGRIFLTSTVISTPIGALLLTFGNLILAFGIIGFIIGFMVGGAIGRTISEAVMRVVPRKRGRPVQRAVGAGIFLGLLIAAAGLLLVTGTRPKLLLVVIYLVSAIPAAMAALK